MHLTHGFDDKCAVGDDDRLIARFVIERVTKQHRDRLVVLADNDDALLQFLHRTEIYPTRIEPANRAR